MSSFAPPALGTRASPDSRKHVNYTLGMVLGVDDFTQEFAYVAGRDQLLARELLGYGTACGLQVTIEPVDNATERLNSPSVMVAPGIAVTPRGQIVSVPVAQCAQVLDWLAAHQDGLRAHVGTEAGTARLSLVLCYRECATDMVPIPGEPCRSEDEAMAASRIKDDFRLDLRWSPPDQREEAALRDFVDWLSQIEISAASDLASVDPGAFTPLADFEDAIRAAATWLGSPPVSPPADVIAESPPSSPPTDFMVGLPPSELRIPADEACTYLRSAFRIWTTELRPRWLGLGATCAGNPPDEECVLLAEINVPIQAGLLNGEVLIDETRRPYLLHLRMLQEWLLCGQRTAAPSDTVVAETEFGVNADAGMSERFSRADHTHGTPALGGDVTGAAGDTFVEGLRHVPLVYDEAGPLAGQVLTFVAGTDEQAGSWQPQDVPTLEGDVSGQIGDNTIGRLQRMPVEAQEPKPGQVLTFVQDEGGGSAWRPVDPQAGPGIGQLDGDVKGAATENTIERLQKTPLEAREPQAGQVLTFVVESEGGAWRPVNPGGGIGELSGDVVGPSNATTTARLRGIDVTYYPDLPSDGQVLTFVSFGDNEGGMWQNRDPQTSARELGGDVVGDPGSTAIERLQNVPVEAREPQPNQVLTFRVDDDQGRWVAADAQQGNPLDEAAVTHPPQAGAYQIVAAGVVRGSGNRRSNTYNGLVSRVIDNGRVMLTFDEYKMPDDFMYIVKALPVINERIREMLDFRAPVVAFEQFTDEGFVLFVSLDNQPADPGLLEQLELMVEVSRYEFRPR